MSSTRAAGFLCFLTNSNMWMQHRRLSFCPHSPCAHKRLFGRPLRAATRSQAAATPPPTTHCRQRSVAIRRPGRARIQGHSRPRACESLSHGRGQSRRDLRGATSRAMSKLPRAGHRAQRRITQPAGGASSCAGPPSGQRSALPPACRPAGCLSPCGGSARPSGARRGAPW